MNEKPGLEPGFFCSTSCRRLDGLRVSQRSPANYAQIADKTMTFARTPLQIDHEHPVVDPHVSHFMQVPFRTSVKLPHSEHISPS